MIDLFIISSWVLRKQSLTVASTNMY